MPPENDAAAEAYPLDEPHGTDIPLPDGFSADLQDCVIGPGPCIPFDPVLLTHCHWLPGSCFTLNEAAAPKDAAMPLPPGFPPPKRSDEAQVPDLGASRDMVALPTLPAIPASAATASVQHPDTVIPAIPAGAFSSPLGLGALAIGALTTGAAWKYWQSRSRLRHEERMKELENEASNQDRNQKCESAAAACEKSTKDLTEALAEINRKLGPLSEAVEAATKKAADAEEKASKVSRASGDLGALEDRVAVLERKAPKKPGRKATKNA